MHRCPLTSDMAQGNEKDHCSLVGGSLRDSQAFGLKGFPAFFRERLN